MCFRPSAVASDQSPQAKTCPSCGMPIEAKAGIPVTECPHCGKPIPADAGGDATGAPSQHGKIL